MSHAPIEFKIEFKYSISDAPTGVRYLISKPATNVSDKRLYFIITGEDALKLAIAITENSILLKQQPASRHGFKDSFYLGHGTVMDVRAHLKRHYLAIMYVAYLRKSVNGNRNDRSLQYVTSKPDLRTLAVAYWSACGNDLVADLAANSFQFNRKRMTLNAPNHPGVSFETPRLLRWYPNEDLVCVTWMLGDSNVDEIYLGEGEKKISVKTSRFMLNRHYQNEGWLTLRELMMEDDSVSDLVDALVRQKVMIPLTEQNAIERAARSTNKPDTDYPPMPSAEGM